MGNKSSLEGNEIEDYGATLELSLWSCHVSYYAAGMIVGLTIMMTAMVAPTLNKKLDRKNFGIVVRVLWPLYFQSMFIISLCSLGVMYYTNDLMTKVVHTSIMSGTCVLSFIDNAIIPMTNQATDTNNLKLFNFLHTISVSSTVLILISNIAFLFL